MSNSDHSPSLGDEAGFVLATAIIVLAVITVLIGAAVTVAMQGSTSTAQDNNQKAALAAAEAGLQASRFRIDQLKPESTQCVNGSESQKLALCESGSEALGNGATFHYWDTDALVSGEKCAGQVVEAKTGVTLRCITAEGSVNGAQPTTRLQSLVESAVGEALFSVKGIVGIEEVLVSGSVKATAIVASNLLIKGEGSAAFEKGFELCPGGKFIPAPGEERNKSGVTVGGVGGTKSNPSLEKTRSASECPIADKIPLEHATAASNEDSRISSGLDPRTENTKGAVVFTGAPTDELTVTSSGTLKLSGSRYYFCRVSIESSSKLIIAPGAKVEIFIDSHADNPSCPEPTKKSSPPFEISGAALIENTNGPAALLIEVAGAGPVKVGASGNLTASIYAPEAEIVLSGAGTLTGAIVGNKVHLTAGSFIYGSESENLVVGGSSAVGYSRKAWQECSSSTTAGGC
jgi:Tfp pilus assembly protein PilX